MITQLGRSPSGADLYPGCARPRELATAKVLGNERIEPNAVIARDMTARALTSLPGGDTKTRRARAVAVVDALVARLHGCADGVEGRNLRHSASSV